MDFWDEVLSDPVQVWRPLPWQRDFLILTARKRLLRAGNQVGKTTTGVVDLVAHARGVNPWTGKGTRKPIEAWVICASWSQSLAVQKKIWELLPKEHLHPDTTYDEVYGFRPIRDPLIRIEHVKGSYSLVRIKTVGQGELNLSSATIQYAWFDEPPRSQSLYVEILKRLQRAGSQGRLVMTMTPINADVSWLQQMTEEPGSDIHDQQVRLEADNFVLMQQAPDGTWHKGPHRIRLDDGTLCDEAWVESVIAETPPHLVDVRCHGGWRVGSIDGVFSAFRTTGPRSHVTDATPAGDLRTYLGFDHGVRRFTQVGVLVVRDADGVYWAMDEAVGETETTDEDDAEATLAMLERNGLYWGQVDEAHGDRAHYGQARGPSIAAKSNGKLARALVRHPRARRHGIAVELHPAIRRAKQGPSNRAGSVEYGIAWLHRAMVSGKFKIHRRCKVGIASLLSYDGTQNSEESHWVDALRYALRNPIWQGEPGEVRRRTSPLRLV